MDKRRFQISFLLLEANTSLTDDGNLALENPENPIDYFFDDELLEYDVQESNKVLLLSWYNNLPSVRMCCSPENDIRNDLVASSIHRDRFLFIIPHLNFVLTSTTDDQDWKI